MTFYALYTNGLLLLAMMVSIFAGYLALKTSRDISKELEENKPR